MGCMMYRFIFVYVSFRYRFTFSLSYSLLNLSKPPNEICQQNYSNASTQKIRECMGELEAFGSYKNIRGANQSHPQRWYQANKEGVFVRSLPHAPTSQPNGDSPKGKDGQRLIEPSEVSAQDVKVDEHKHTCYDKDWQR